MVVVNANLPFVLRQERADPLAELATEVLDPGRTTAEGIDAGVDRMGEKLEEVLGAGELPAGACVLADSPQWESCLGVPEPHGELADARGTIELIEHQPEGILHPLVGIESDPA